MFLYDQLWIHRTMIAMPALGCGFGGLAWEPVRDAVDLPYGWRVRLYDNR